MSEEKFEQLELDFTEGEKEMEQLKVLEGNETTDAVVTPVVADPSPEAPQEAQGPQVVAAVTIQVLDNGGLDIQVPEGMPELKHADVESVARQVYEQLRDMRIAQSALDLFKQRLSL